MAQITIGPITINNQDLIKLWDVSNKVFKSVKSAITNMLPKNLNVCLIDGRYKENGFIKETGKIKCSIKELEKVLSQPVQLTNPFRADYGIDLKYIFNDNMLLESSGELTGYEDLDIDDFDIVVDLDKMNLFPEWIKME